MIENGSGTLGYGLSGIIFIACGIGSIKALRRIHADWNETDKNEKYVEQRVRAAVGNFFNAVGFLLSGTTVCYMSALSGKALIFGGVDLAAKTAALNFVLPAACISVALVAIGFFLVPSGAPNAISESPI